MNIVETIIEQDISVPQNAYVDYAQLSDLFCYPRVEDYRDKVAVIYSYLQNQLPEASASLRPFAEFCNNSTIIEIQELFLRSFDVQAITTLDIGFVLFGEDFKRGKLLVHLNEEHRRAGNQCDTELSDHLPNILKLLPKIKDAEVRTEIATLLLMPAVDKMISEFSTEKIKKKDTIYKKHQKVLLDYSNNHRTIYQHCLKTLFIVLYTDFGPQYESAQSLDQSADSNDPHVPKSSDKKQELKDFGQSIESEMLTEK